MSQSEQTKDTLAGSNIYNKNKPISSCLRNGSTSSNSSVLKHRVSFPDDDKNLVTAYLEPNSPWDNSPVTPDDLIALYQDSCLKHRTTPLEQVINQLKTCYLPHPRLEIIGSINLETLEALETVLKRVRFHELRIKSNELNDDAAEALFDILEYYESAATLSLTCEAGLGLRSWQACSKMLKKAHGLSELDIRGTPVDEQVMPVLCRALKVGCKLTALQLARCGTSERALVILVNALRLNSHLQELTLSDNDLVAADAVHLGLMLRSNSTIRYLNISNNAIGDDGCLSLCDALSEQRGEGLEALVMWNTALTSIAGCHVAKVLISLSPLETLNIGQNQIGSTGLSAIKKAMLENDKLKQLGMQAAQVDCDGAESLAEIIMNNNLLRLDVRSNHIGLRGLEAILQALQAGATIERLDLDDVSGPCQDVIEDIRQFCRINEARAQAAQEKSHISSSFSRKISLTCETLMMRSAVEGRGLLAEPRRAGRLRSPAPSPIPSPSSSPIPSPSRHRFRVSRVSEDSSPVSPVSPVVSRFRVTVVEPDSDVPTEMPPNSVVSDGSKVHIGFETPPPQSSPRKVSATAKPQTSIEKLLGLFQNSASLLSSVANVTLSGSKDKNTQSHEGNWEWDWGCKDAESKTNNNV